LKNTLFLRSEFRKNCKKSKNKIPQFFSLLFPPQANAIALNEEGDLYFSGHLILAPELAAGAQKEGEHIRY
jgi:hypothetical protein